MNSIPSPRLITEQVREFQPETKVILRLLNLRRSRPLTELEQDEYEQACAAADQRIAQAFAAEMIHDRNTEARSFPEKRINFHE